MAQFMRKVAPRVTRTSVFDCRAILLLFFLVFFSVYFSLFAERHHASMESSSSKQIFFIANMRMKGPARLAARTVKCFLGPLRHEVIVVSDQCNSVRNAIRVLRYQGVRTELDIVDTKRAVRKSD